VLQSRSPRRLAVLPLVLVLVAGVALLAGCGGGDDGPQTKEGFILDADGVCEDFLGEFADAGADDPGTAREVADANKVLADVYEKFSNRISDVRLPEAAAARKGAAAYVSSVRMSEQLLDGLRSSADDFLAAAEGTDARALTTAGNNLRVALDRFRASRAQSDTLAISYGLNLCGNLD
jgi:hypothetical protein